MESDVHLIQDLLEQWRKLTSDEAEAIRLGRWQELLSAQESKRGLQQQVEMICRKLQNRPASATGEWEALRTTSRVLLEQERQNERALAEQRRVAECASRQSQNALRQLHQLGRAYGHASANSWQSYS